MKTKLLLISMSFGILLFFSCSSPKNEPALTTPQKTDISEFLGQWTIDIEGGSVGWLEVRQEDGYVDADVLWGGGSVLPVSNIFIAKDHVLMIQRSNNIVIKRDENKNPVKTLVVTDWMEITKAGDKINGILLSPRRNGLSFLWYPRHLIWQLLNTENR
jgi:hypothetical protein